MRPAAAAAAATARARTSSARQPPGREPGRGQQQRGDHQPHRHRVERQGGDQRAGQQRRRDPDRSTTAPASGRPAGSASASDQRSRRARADSGSSQRAGRSRRPSTRGSRSPAPPDQTGWRRRPAGATAAPVSSAADRGDTAARPTAWVTEVVSPHGRGSSQVDDGQRHQQPEQHQGERRWDRGPGRGEQGDGQQQLGDGGARADPDGHGSRAQQGEAATIAAAASSGQTSRPPQSERPGAVVVEHAVQGVAGQRHPGARRPPGRLRRWP